MMPRSIEKLGVEYMPRLVDAVRGVDVIMMLRIQKERQQGNRFPTEREYARFFGLNRAVLQHAREDVLIMHPGPVNRGVEISPDVMSLPYSIIIDQVTSGVAIRMALMYLYTGK
jgi:aspartate carbamoyltransferase catalytic subunit